MGSIKTSDEPRDGKPVLVRLPELNFIYDKTGKPVGIHSHICRRPIAAFGNSDGDLQMLQWTAAGPGAGREFADGAESHIGTFSDALLTAARKRGWTVISSTALLNFMVIASKT